MNQTTLTASLILALATPALAGGPVVIMEEPEIVTERPASSVNPIVPLLLLLVIGVAVSGSGSRDSTNTNSGEQGDDTTVN